MKLRKTPRRRSSADVDFVAFGENSVDTIALGLGRWGDGSKHRLTSLVELPGGQAATAAVACARLGWRSKYVGVVGDDDAGKSVRQTLAQERVSVVAVTRAGSPTRRAVVLVDAATGERTVLEYRDPALNLNPRELLDDVFTNARVLLLDGSDPAQAKRAARAARAADVRTVVDVDRADAEIAELLRLVDVIVVPEATAGALAGVSELGLGLAFIGRETGAVAVVATLGAEGALAWCAGQEVRVPGRAVDVVDTTGAGDAFRAGFCAGWLGREGSDPNLEDLLEDANLVASLSCRGLGAQTGLPQAFEVPGHLRGRV